MFRIDDSTLINIHFLRLSYTYLSLYNQLHEYYEAKAQFLVRIDIGYDFKKLQVWKKYKCIQFTERRREM